MKSITQIVILVVVVVGGIAGVTFVSQYDWLNRKKPKPPARPTDEPVLFFPVVASQGQFTSEIGTTGHFDFVFENRQTESVSLYLLKTSCRCTHVEIGFPRREDWQYLERTAGMTSLTNSLVAPAGSLDPGSLGRHLLEQNIRWLSLEEKAKDAVVAPAAESANTPTIGLVRVHWRGDKVGPHLLQAKLRAVGPPETLEFDLEVPASFVPPLDVYPETLTAGALTARGQTRTLEFWCFSFTRDRFSLAAKEADGDPHFVCECSPLTEVELQTLAATMKTPIRSAYLIKVTVHERRSENEPLDIGRFRRQLVLVSDPDLEPLRVPLEGMVRGEVTIGRAEDKSQIDLGNFDARSGHSKSIAMTTEQQQLQLEIAESSPKYLQVKLQENPQGGTGVSKQWNLQVTIPPNQAVGRLPEESCIVLRTKSTTPRRVRIPVKGNGYRSAAER